MEAARVAPRRSLAAEVAKGLWAAVCPQPEDSGPVAFPFRYVDILV